MKENEWGKCFRKICTSKSTGLYQYWYYILVLRVFAKNQPHVLQQGQSITIPGIGRPAPSWNSLIQRPSHLSLRSKGHWEWWAVLQDYFEFIQRDSLLPKFSFSSSHRAVISAISWSYLFKLLVSCLHHVLLIKTLVFSILREWSAWV